MDDQRIEIASVCEHGSLKRQCRVCELEEELRSLRLSLLEVNATHLEQRQRANAAEAELRTVREERDAFVENRERVRRSFGHVGGGCQCVYCQRDVEGLAEHAADYEMRYHSAAHARDLNQTRAREVEAELHRLEMEMHEVSLYLLFDVLGALGTGNTDSLMTLAKAATRHVVERFYLAVNARAEADMLKGNPIQGAHHRALEAEIEAYRVAGQVPRKDE